MASKNTIYIPIQAMVQGFAGGSEAALDAISAKINAAIAPLMKGLNINIDPSIASLQQLEQYLTSINATITQTGNSFTIMAQGADGLQGVITLTQKENEVAQQSMSITSQRISVSQQLQQTYQSLIQAQREVNSLEEKGMTSGEAYQQATATVQAYNTQIQNLIATIQQQYNVEVQENAETERSQILGNGKCATIQREAEYTLNLVNTKHQEVVAAQAANAAKQQEQAAASRYLSLMNQLYSAEVRLATMKQGGANSQAIAAQQQYINVLQQQAAALKSKITDEQLLIQIEEQLAVAQAKANAQMQQGSTAIKKQQSLFGSLVASMKMVIKTALLYSIAYGAIYKVVEAFQATIDTVKELDKAIVDLQIVTGKSREVATEMLKTYNKMAQELGATTTEIANAAVEWQRQGYSTEQTNQLIRNSTILAKVGMLDTAEAQEYLTSAMKGYNKSVEESIQIVDMLTAIDLKAAVSAGGLAEAMSRTAASAELAGVEMEQLLGYIAVVGEVTQKSMSSVGESKFI